MAAKKLVDYSKEELVKQKKSLINILVIIGILEILFILYLVYTLMAGIWKSVNLGGVIAIIMLGSVMVTYFIKISRINTELMRRKG